jgi:hypothetical protein
VLDRFAQECHEFARLAVVDGHSLVWVAHAQGASGGLVYQPSLTSNTVPLFATASGKAWLATLPTDQAMHLVMKNGGLKDADRYGPNVVHSVEALLRELKATGRRGYGLAFNEAEFGVTAVGAAIRADDGAPALGTVSIVIPNAHRRSVYELAPLVCAPQRSCRACGRCEWGRPRRTGARRGSERVGDERSPEARRLDSLRFTPAMTKLRLGCIADYFTGATDLANNLVRAGMRVVQAIGVPVRPIEIEADAVVVALKTRANRESGRGSACRRCATRAPINLLLAARRSTYAGRQHRPGHGGLVDLRSFAGGRFHDCHARFSGQPANGVQGSPVRRGRAAQRKRDAASSTYANDRCQPRAGAAAPMPTQSGIGGLPGRGARS